MTTKNDTIVTDEEQIQKDDQRFKEITEKPEAERTGDETKELGEIKERYSKRVEQRIGKLTKAEKLASERAEKAERERAELQERLDKIEKEKESKPTDFIGDENETVTVGDKQFFTDAALWAKIKANKISQQQAEKHAKERDKEEYVLEAMSRIKGQEEKESNERTRKEDIAKVLKEYPHFSKTHVDYNPDDPLLKLVDEIYTEAYAANPRGMSLAIKRAKQILGRTDAHVDRTDDLNIGDGGVPKKGSPQKIDNVTLDEKEKNWAIQMYCRGDAINPRTGKPYTQAEALAKALAGKKKSIERYGG